MKKVIFILCFLVQASAFAGLLFPYHRLATKDLDQMNQLIKDKIKESKSSGGDKTVPLKEALQAVFSRPNDDSMIEKLLPTVKGELDEHDAYEKTFRLLVKEASGALNNPKAFKSEALLTYMVFLENALAEMKPKIQEPFENSIFTQIRDAKIRYTKEMLNHRKHRMLKELPTPSELAENYLKELAEKEKALAEKQKAEALSNSQPQRQ